MQQPLHSSFGKNIVTQDGCAVLIIGVVTKPNAINPGKTQSQIALSTPFTTPYLWPLSLLPAPPDHPAGRVGRRKKPKVNK